MFSESDRIPMDNKVKSQEIIKIKNWLNALRESCMYGNAYAFARYMWLDEEIADSTIKNASCKITFNLNTLRLNLRERNIVADDLAKKKKIIVQVVLDDADGLIRPRASYSLVEIPCTHRF